MENCAPCTESVFKKLSSKPDFKDFLDVIQENQPNQVRVDTDTQRISFREETINGVTTFYANFIPYVPLEILNFTLDQSGLKLKGTVINTINLNWEYNKQVEIQSLTGGLSAPIPTSSLTYSLQATDQNISTNRSYTLNADDDTSDDIPSRSANQSITFGNYIYQTQIEASDRDDIVAGTINGLTLVDLTKTNRTTRNLTFTCESDATEYEVLLVPNSLGLTSGNQFRNDGNNLTGGWSKLFDITLENELEFSEPYGCWVAVNRNLNGATFTIL